MAPRGVAWEGTEREALEGARVCGSVIDTSASPGGRTILDLGCLCVWQPERYSSPGSTCRFDAIGDICFDCILFDIDSVRKKSLKALIARNETCAVIPPPFHPHERTDP